MQIYINKDGQQLGHFDEAKIREMLQKGELSPNDLGIRQGETAWGKLSILYPNLEKVSLAIPTPLPPKKNG